MQVNINGGGSGKTANKGSASDLAIYGEHEHLERESEHRLGVRDAKCMWFDEAGNLTSEEVTVKIDNNKKGLKKDDAKFYEFEICPSMEEQSAMFKGCKTDRQREEVFKAYIRERVMEDYARNFKGYKGKDFHKENICWAAVIHTERKQSPGRGDGWHSHVIVSHRTADMKTSISPRKNQRSENKGRCQGYFDRCEFIRTCEQSFDERFKYDRPQEQTFDAKNANKNPGVPEIVKARTAEEINLTAAKRWREMKRQAKEKLENEASERAKAKAEREAKERIERAERAAKERARIKAEEDAKRKAEEERRAEKERQKELRIKIFKSQTNMDEGYYEKMLARAKSAISPIAEKIHEKKEWMAENQTIRLVSLIREMQADGIGSDQMKVILLDGAEMVCEKYRRQYPTYVKNDVLTDDLWEKTKSIINKNVDYQLSLGNGRGIRY